MYAILLRKKYKPATAIMIGSLLCVFVLTTLHTSDAGEYAVAAYRTFKVLLSISMPYWPSPEPSLKLQNYVQLQFSDKLVYRSTYRHNTEPTHHSFCITTDQSLIPGGVYTISGQLISKQYSSNWLGQLVFNKYICRPNQRGCGRGGVLGPKHLGNS